METIQKCKLFILIRFRRKAGQLLQAGSESFLKKNTGQSERAVVAGRERGMDNSLEAYY